MQTLNRKYQEILVSIDAILDTRIGTIARYNPELAAKVLESGNYHNRVYDEFGDLSIDDFKALYARRDKEVLKHSTLTRIIKFVAEICAAMTVEASQNPTSEYPSVVINAYPYDLSDEELKMIGLAVKSYLAEEVPVRVENNPWDFYDPRYCREHVAAIIVYNNEEWMEANSKSFSKSVCPQVSLYTASLFFDQKHAPEDIAKITEVAMNPFDAIEFYAKPIIAMQLMNVSEFSIFK